MYMFNTYFSHSLHVFLEVEEVKRFILEKYDSSNPSRFLLELVKMVSLIN